MMKKIYAFIKILRPLNLSIAAFAVIVTALILNKIDMVSVWLKALIVVVCYNGAANAINDYFDQETDRINRPNRPLITGIISPKAVLVFSILLFIIGTFFAVLLPMQSTIIAVAIALPLMVAYSFWLKSVPLLGNFIISFVLGLTFLFAGSALSEMMALWIIAILAVGLTMVRELVKDIADYDGDIKTNIRTFPTIFGIKKAWILAAIFALIIGLGALIPYWFGKFNQWYLYLIIFGIEIPLATTVFFAVKFPTIINAKRDASLLKYSTIMGVFAFWLGSM